jgi:diadenosine tetraphosphatase ApaH/serine/threonine PP2A family protein phosphatase
MRLALIADIHSNLEALTAVLKEIDDRQVDAIYCLGDIVGYGSDAAICTDMVRERCAGAVMGNHDQAVALGIGVRRLPRDARKAARHNRKQLSEVQLQYLRSLPLSLRADGCTFVHATPERPEAWMRIDSLRRATAQFEHFDTDVCFIGHTHVPAVMSNRLGILTVRRGYRYLINVGSVGQPRDLNPEACGAVFDTETFSYEVFRTPYDIDQTVEKIAESGLPARLGERLRVGL